VALFTSTSRLGEDSLEGEAHRTGRARDIYTYGHVLIVSGIILIAVGDELVIAHPLRPLEGPALVAVVAGPALFLLAQLTLQLRGTRRVAYSRVAAIAICAAVGLFASGSPALVVGAVLVATLVPVAAFGGLRRSIGDRVRREGSG